MKDAVVLKFKDVVLRDSNLDILRAPCYLDDRIIRFYFAYLSSSIDTITDVLLVEPFQSLLIAIDKETKNMFLHFDSMKGVNNFHAEKLYNAVKEYMGPGGEVSRPQTSSSSRKKQGNRKKSVTRGAKDTMIAGLPEFRECETPQQTNGYDCGLYVLAIAREICQWCSRGHNKNDMISTIQKNVDYSVEMKMRGEVLKIIEEMTTDS
ncbi:NEDD8-specific protease 1-like [Apium graveolens]|uniref:NEDD8-specific protease 1-like n=1 Tax=Apium graveolens TaxID=4045 RepID=UPI003D7A467F